MPTSSSSLPLSPRSRSPLSGKKNKKKASKSPYDLNEFDFGEYGNENGTSDIDIEKIQQRHRTGTPGKKGMKNRGKKVSKFVKKVVRDALKQYEFDNRPDPVPEIPFYRCIVCSLPGGTCKHTPSWLHFAFEKRNRDKVDEKVEKLVNVLLPENAISQHLHENNQLESENRGREENEENPDPNNEPVFDTTRKLQWMEPIVFSNDYLNGKPVDMSSPPALGGHSMINMDTNLVLFGGIGASSNLKKAKTFQPFRSSLDPEHYGVYKNDVHIYDFLDCRWKTLIIDPKKPKPAPRAFHIAAAINNKHMFIFGGRGDEGVIFDDSWILDINRGTWEKLELMHEHNKDKVVTSPSARFLAAAGCIGGDIYVFGGRDYNRIYGDLWVWNNTRKEWSSPLTVGVPPAARFGHSLIVTEEGTLMILGGCTAGGRIGGTTALRYEKNDLELWSAVKRLSDSYIEENNAAIQGGTMLASNIHTMDLSQLARSAQFVSSSIAANEAISKHLEKETAIVEKQLRLDDVWRQLQGSHNCPVVDVTFLDPITLAWTTPLYPPVSGKAPISRMMCSTVYSKDMKRVLVFGGCTPKSDEITLSDRHIFSLSLRSKKWSNPLVEHTPETMDDSISMAKIKVKKASEKVKNAVARSLHMGVPGGRSVEVAWAEAELEATKAYEKKLIQERNRFSNNAISRYGHASTIYCGRLYIHGGWDMDSTRDDFLVLDFEKADERERRLSNEFVARLERERSQRELKEILELRKILYEQMMFRKSEEAKEERERKLMAYEDFLSSIPPKTKAPTPKITWANGSSMTLKWEKATRNCKGKYLRDGQVVYHLMMKGISWKPLHVGDKVLVEVTPGEKDPYYPPKFRVPKQDIAVPVSMYPLSYGKVKKCHLNGTYDIGYEPDGFKEEKVERSRIRPAKEPEWATIYRGKKNEFTVTNLVPDFILERIPGYETLVCFQLECIGTEWPVNETSITSEVAIGYTKNPLPNEKKGTKFKLRKAIQLENSVIQVWDKYVMGEGQGKHYL